MLRQLTGFAKAYNPWDVQVPERKPRSCPPPSIKVAYTDALGTRFADIESPDALGTIQLMPPERDMRSTWQVIDIAGNLPCALHGIAVEPHAMLAGDSTQWPLTDRRRRFHCWRTHHGDQHGVRGNGLANVIRIDQAHAIHRHICVTLKPLFSRALTAIQHRLVPSGGGDDMVALGSR